MPTDLERVPDPVGAVANLPPGAAVILRDADHPERERLGGDLRRATRSRGLLLLVSGDPELVAALGADGLHVPERMLGAEPTRSWRRANPWKLMTAACHSLRALRQAERAGADLALLSPVFPTASHPGGHVLGPFRASAIARASGMPVLAMGGIDAATSCRLPPTFFGVAAIGMLADSGRR